MQIEVRHRVQLLSPGGAGRRWPAGSVKARRSSRCQVTQIRSSSLLLFFVDVVVVIVVVIVVVDQ